jgi:hypothetical protein
LFTLHCTFYLFAALFSAIKSLYYLFFSPTSIFFLDITFGGDLVLTPVYYVFNELSKAFSKSVLFCTEHFFLSFPNFPFPKSGKKWYPKWENPPKRFEFPAFISSDFPFRVGRSIIRLSPCLCRAAVPAPCRLHVMNGYRQRSAGPAQAQNTKSLFVSSMPRSDTIQARWNATDSENEDSTSYNIQFTDIPSSKDEFGEPSPSRYQHARTKKMLIQLLQQPSSEEESDYEEGDSKFSHFWGKLIS